MLKHTGPGALLEVEVLRKCTALRCEARVEVKSVKKCHLRDIFGSSDVEKFARSAAARIAFGSHKC